MQEWIVRNLKRPEISIGFVVALVVSLFWPSVSFAWGPITHLSFGLSLLEQIHLLAPQIGALLAAYPRDFLYGCLAADITLGKRFVAHESHHCHNWSVGFEVLEAAGNEREESFAYGYLAHLAADTISHNLYVPYRIAASFESNALKHIYWEIRYDSLASEETWGMALELIQDRGLLTHNALLEKTLKRALFSFKTNKVIFNRLIAVQNIKQWRKFIGYLNKRSRFQLSDGEAAEYRSLVHAATLDFFVHVKDASILEVDPSGHEALRIGHTKRRELKELHANEELPHDVLHLTLQEIREHFIGRLPHPISSKRHAHSHIAQGSPTRKNLKRLMSA